MDHKEASGQRSDSEEIFQENIDPTRMLISPPPEEELRIQRTPRTAPQPKRKRQPPHPQQLTPNPKPRKQLRNRMTTPSPTRSRSPSKLMLNESPYANNPRANYLPPDVIHPARRRSATPVIVPYEPPKDVFTPPREVLIIPQTHTPRRQSKLNRRAPLSIKLEPPVIDLSEPMPPGSPTDDPLLLKDPPEPPPREPLPPSTPPRAPSTPNNNRTCDTSMDSIDLEGPPAMDILFPGAREADSGCGWGDSDGDDEDTVMEGEDEFTGRWRLRIVPTKSDPPSSATRQRMDSWGRPISPHPYPRRHSRIPEEDDEDAGEASDEQARETSTNRAGQCPDIAREREEERVHANEVPVADYADEQPLNPQPAYLAHEEDDYDMKPADSAEQKTRVSPCQEVADEQSFNENQQSLNEDEQAEEEEVRAMSVDPEQSGDRQDDIRVTDSMDEGEEAEEEEEVRAMSIEREAAPTPTSVRRIPSLTLVTPRLEETPVRHSSLSRLQGEMEDSDGDNEDDPLLDLDMVKIMSSNPQAAARVVAILKQHNWDAYTKKNLRQNENVRRKTIDGAIEKRIPFGTPKRNRRRDTLGGVIGDNVYIPGSPIMTVEGLLQRAETEVKQQISNTPISSPRRTPISVDEWGKEEWKTLDMCFTEERYEIGGGDTMADVDQVDVKKVTARFRDLVDGPWANEELEQRTIAIAKKQRGGKIAPPLTPRGTSRIHSFASESPLERRGRLASMVVPDFTPLGRRAMPPARANKPTVSTFRLPEPTSAGAPFQNLAPLSKKVPSVLFAPRYSHLLDEAHNVTAGKPKIAAASDAEEDEEEEELDEEEEDSENEEEDDSEMAATSMEEEVKMDVRPQQNLFQTPAPQSRRPPPRTSIGNRVKGFFFSYLPGTKTAPKPTKRSVPQPSHLPPPPAELRDKQRGPINTPVKPPGPKEKPPKDLVDLNHIEVPKPKSMIPRRVPPKRLVDLAHVSPEKEQQKKDAQRPRRSSNGSVKDMVKGFEQLSESQSRAIELKRTKSIGEVAGRNRQDTGRPVWK